MQRAKFETGRFPFLTVIKLGTHGNIFAHRGNFMDERKGSLWLSQKCKKRREPSAIGAAGFRGRGERGVLTNRGSSGKGMLLGREGAEGGPLQDVFLWWSGKGKARGGERNCPAL